MANVVKVAALLRSVMMPASTELCSGEDEGLKASMRNIRGVWLKSTTAVGNATVVLLLEVELICRRFDELYQLTVGCPVTADQPTGRLPVEVVVKFSHHPPVTSDPRVMKTPSSFGQLCADMSLMAVRL